MIEFIPIKKLRISKFKPKYQYPRKVFQNLKKSIKEHGIMQPLIVRQDSLSILNGVQRFKAAKSLGLKTVPCQVMPMTDKEEAEYRIMQPVNYIKVNKADYRRGLKQLLK